MDKARYINPPDGTYIYHQDDWVEYHEPSAPIGSSLSWADVALVIFVLLILLALYVF